MLISVVTVAWNAAQSIDATCRSVDMQTHPDVEHLVIDGGSTDGTLEVLARRVHANRVVHSEPDEGLYDAMNKGVERASGDIVVFLNADDRYCSADVLAQVHQAFVDSGADAVYCDIDMVIEAEPLRVQRRWRSGPPAAWKVLLGWQVPHPGLFIRRSMLQQLGRFDSRMRIAADYDLMLRLMRRRGVRLHYLPLTVAEMAVGGVSTSGLRSTWRGYRESATAARRHFGPAGWLIALLKPMWKLPQWLPSRATARPRPDRAADKDDSRGR
jgi:glycosyltransferase involved in cell wall biosynthesis